METKRRRRIPRDPKYDRLLHEIQPRPPRSKEENERLLAAIGKLMRKGEDNRTPADDTMLDLLFTLVGEYERNVHPPKKSTPADVSEILAGKREVRKEQAKRPGEFFHLSPAFFI